MVASVLSPPRKLPDSGHRITGAPVRTRDVRFTIERIREERATCPSYWRYRWGINGRRYDGNEIAHRPVVGTVEDWHLTADPFVGEHGHAEPMIHPFHIHVNPFLVLSINGKALRTPMWKDVVVVPSTADGVRLRTR